MGCADFRVLPVACVCCCVFWLIFTIVALSTSFKQLDQGYYALTLSWVYQTVGDDVVSQPGVQNLGMGNTLVVYPSTYQTLYFVSGVASACSNEIDPECNHVIRSPITVRSQDGLQMEVAMSFQWRLQPQALKPLYNILGDDLYKDAFVRFARASIVEACSLFTADLFFTNRTTITEKMMDVLSDNFNHPTRGLAVDIQDLELREVDVPDEFDNEIASTQEQTQEVQVALAQRTQQTIAMQRQVLVAGDQVQQTINLAAGEAEKIRLANVAVVQQLLNLQQQQALANAQILQAFANDTDPFGKLLQLMKVKAITDHNTTSLLVNL